MKGAIQVEESIFPEKKMELILAAASIGKRKDRMWYKIPWSDALDMVGKRRLHMEHGKGSKL